MNDILRRDDLELTLVPFADSRSASPDPILPSGRSSPGWDDLINTSMSPGISRVQSDPSICALPFRKPMESPSTTGSRPSSGEPSLTSPPASPSLARLRREILDMLGVLLDRGLLSKDDTCECIRLATSCDRDTVRAMGDLLGARKSYEGKAQFLSFFIIGRRSSVPQVMTPMYNHPFYNPYAALGYPPVSHYHTVTPSEDLMYGGLYAEDPGRRSESLRRSRYSFVSPPPSASPSYPPPAPRKRSASPPPVPAPTPADTPPLLFRAPSFRELA